MSTISPTSIARLLHRFGLERDRLRVVLAEAAGLAPADIDALEHLEADGPLTQRQLGDRLLLTSGGVTVLVDRLERAGLLTRGPHPTDRRSVLLHLTPRAQDHAPGELTTYHEAVSQAAGNVPTEHREALTAFLTAVTEHASAATDTLRAAKG